MGTRAKNVVPNPTNSLDTGEDVGEPGEHPRYDEWQHVHILKALEDLLEVLILFQQ